MRKLIPVLFAVGGFLLIAGLLAAIYAPGVVEKTPLDVNTTTRLSGQAARLDAASGAFDTMPVKARSINQVDSKSSDGSTAVFTSSTCVLFDVDDAPACVDGTDERLIAATTDVFATDRKTALSVSSSKLPADAVKHEGLVNKWPFNAEKKTYPLWDGTLAKAVPAAYDRTQKVDGHATYVYRATVESAPIQVLKGVSGTYDDVKEVFVDPRTGAIINQTEKQQRALGDGTKALDLKLGFTTAQVKANVVDAESNITQLNVLTRLVPIIGIGGGVVVLLVAGLLIARLRSRARV